MDAINSTYTQLQSDLLNNPADQESLMKDAYAFEVASQGGHAPGTAATMDAVNNMVASFGDQTYHADSGDSSKAIGAAAMKDGIVGGGINAGGATMSPTAAMAISQVSASLRQLDPNALPPQLAKSRDPQSS